MSNDSVGLFDLKQYLETEKSATLWDIAQHFSQDTVLIEAMLQHWVDSGHVMLSTKTAHCGKQCSQCLPAQTYCYTWVG